MNIENRQIYDRNIRLWGNKIQEVISNSNVLLINLSSGAISEVAKNLILSGINLILYDKHEVVQMKDIQYNFFYCYDDIGKNKALILQAKLLTINPLVTICIYTFNDILIKSNEIHSAVCDHSEILYSPIEEILKDKHIITYYIDIQEQKGYFVNNIEILGKRESAKQKEIKNNYIITLDEDGNNNNVLNGNSKQDELMTKEQEIILDDFGNDIDRLDDRLKKIAAKEDFVYCTLMKKYKLMNNQLRECQRMNSETNLNHWIYLSKYILQIDDKKYKDELKDYFDDKTNFNNQLFVISCVIAGVVSLEVIKVISMSEIPNCNLYVYDCDIEQGDFLFV